MASTTVEQQSHNSFALQFDQATLRKLSVVAVILIAAFLRLYQLGTESFWIDEVTMVYATNSGWGEVLQEVQAGRPSLFVVVGYFWLSIFGPTEMAARLLSAICGIASVMVFYQVGKELFNHRIAIIATLIMTFAEFHIFQSQNYRYYAIYILMVLISFLYLNRYLQTGKKYTLIPYICASILTYYAHGHGMFIIFGQGVFFLLQIWRYRDRITYWVASEIAIFIGILPGLFIMFRDFFQVTEDVTEGLFGPATWISLPTPFSIVRTLTRFILYVPEYLSVIPIVLAFGFFLAVLLIFMRNKGTKWFSNLKGLPASVKNSFATDNRSLIFVLCWFIFPLFLPFVLSYIVAPMYVDRYVLAASMPFYLLIAYVLYQLRNVLPEVAVIGALLIVMIPGLYNNYYMAPVNEQWRDITDYLEQNSQDGDVILIASNSPDRMAQIEQSVAWYYDGSLPQCTFREDMKDDDEEVASMLDCISGYDRVWVTALRWNGDAAFKGKLEPFFAELEDPYTVTENRPYKNSVLFLFEPER